MDLLTNCLLAALTLHNQKSYINVNLNTITNDDDASLGHFNLAANDWRYKLGGSNKVNYRTKLNLWNILKSKQPSISCLKPLKS